MGFPPVLFMPSRPQGAHSRLDITVSPEAKRRRQPLSSATKRKISRRLFIISAIDGRPLVAIPPCSPAWRLNSRGCDGNRWEQE